MIRAIIRINSVLMILLAAAFLIYPAVRAILDIRDPALQGPGVPQSAWRLYRNLTPRYAAWARNRVAQGQPENLSLDNIAGTEWPLFGSVFYLWSLENLQAAWDAGDHSEPEPRVFAQDAIVAASELVIDPNHAAWVKKHWGTNYLHQENVFYRMMVMAALTSRAKLLRDNAHLDMLRDQVESFAKELDGTRSGLMDDYPGQCYPGDVMAALMCIKRADTVLGTDHTKFLTRAVRGFTGARATKYQLPPYSANAGTGAPNSPSRGCGNSYMCLTSPELWPVQARIWFDLYDKQFWQERISAVGFREYPKDDAPSEWTMDVDAGPVVAGHGVSASSFGLAAARKQGRFDRAYPLAAEMLATVWELPNGMMAVPRLLSNFTDAPLLGEAAILWQLSTQPEPKWPIKTGGKVPGYVYIVIGGMLFVGIFRVLASAMNLRDAGRPPGPDVRAPALQIGLWICLLIGAGAAYATSHGFIALVILVFAALLPIEKRKKKLKGTEDWPEEKPESPVPQPK